MPTTGPMLAFLPAETLINRVAIRCGLSPSTNPVGDTNPDMVLMLELLNKMGEDLASQVTNYTHKMGSILCPGGVDPVLPLPVDFVALVSDGVWRDTDDMQLTGPVPQTDMDEAVLSGDPVPSPPWFSLGDGGMYVYPVQDAGVHVQFRYESSYWVGVSGATTATQSGVVLGTDVPFYDPKLLLAGLLYEFKTAKGQDNGVALADYTARLQTAKASSRSAPVLDMAGGGLTRTQFISNANSGDQILG
jgi:hypothetical protein